MMWAKKTIYLMVMVASCTNVNCIAYNQTSFVHNLYSLRTLLGGCFVHSSPQTWKEFLTILQVCLKRRSLYNLDRALNYDVIELWDGVQLVKSQEHNSSFSNTRKLNYNTRIDDWNAQVAQKIGDILDNHVLKIYLRDITANEDEKTEGRRRHRHGYMMPLMVFGTFALGMILVPMGFQFLAVLGGKALLLAKMALILTSIQGLKKIATSNVNYGLYHTPRNYDRQWPYEVADADFNKGDQFYDLPDEVHQANPRVIHETNTFLQ